ncbi:MAG: hypothetical protein ACHQAY_15420 [Hyphomicrobiales bacterium]
MPDLDRALADISAIRGQMARGSEFRGYGPMTMAGTGVLALLAASLQALWLPDPASDVSSYIALWVTAAAASALLIGVEMVARTRRIHHGLADEMIQAAIGEFMPAGIAGALVTFVLFRCAPQNLSMLPGLWQVMFSLGVFASCRSLPRPIFMVAIWYLFAGLANLALAGEGATFSPWAMGAPFGVGQMLVALILHRSFAEHHADG